MFEFLGLGLFALLLMLLGVLIAVVVSGFFLWIALKIVGEERGIISAGIANIVAGLVASISGALVSFLPLFGLLSPVISFLVYVYILSAMLNISFLKAIAVSVIASIVFYVVVAVTAMMLGLTMFPVYSIHRFGRPF